MIELFIKNNPETKLNIKRMISEINFEVSGEDNKNKIKKGIGKGKVGEDNKLNREKKKGFKKGQSLNSVIV